MAVTYIFTPSTIIASSEVNTNFEEVDYTDIDNNRAIQWRNAANALDAEIFENTNDDLVARIATTSAFQVQNQSSQGIFSVDDNDDTVQTRFGMDFRVNDSDNDQYCQITADGNTSLIEAVGGNGNIRIKPEANGDLISFALLPRDNNGSATYPNNTHIQRGWGYITGDGTGLIQATVTFPIAYSTDNIAVVPSFIGYRASASGVPPDEGGHAAISNVVCPSATNITTTTFRLDLNAEVGTTFNSGDYYVFAWIAIGPA